MKVLLDVGFCLFVCFRDLLYFSYMKIVKIRIYSFVS